MIVFRPRCGTGIILADFLVSALVNGEKKTILNFLRLAPTVSFDKILVQRWAFMKTFKALNLSLLTLFEADEIVEGERHMYCTHRMYNKHHFCTQL